MKLSALIKSLSNVYLKHGDVDVYIAPRTLMPRKTYRIELTPQRLYIANKKTEPELYIKLDLQ
jgi:hypothetical protein